MNQTCTQVQKWMPRRFRQVPCCPVHTCLTAKLTLGRCLVQDKDGKMLYLQKMIDSVSTALGEQVLAKPAKVWCCLYQRQNNHHQPISLSFV